MTMGTSRILDIPCKVCQDNSSGKHYNIFACDGCAGFFKRSIRRDRKYVCKSKIPGSCKIDKAHRNQCRACRLQKCQDAGMNKEAVQHERGPRNSTIRKAMSSYMDQHRSAIFDGHHPFGAAPSGMPAMSNAAYGSLLNISTSRVPFPPPSSMEGSVMPLMQPFLPPLSVIPRVAAPSLHARSPSIPAALPMSPDEICESAANLLFLDLKWAETIPHFASLSRNDQLLMLESNWKDLFIFGVIQYLPVMDLTVLIERSDAFKSEKAAEFVKHVQEYQELVLRAKELSLDPNEFFYLRLVAFFRAGHTSRDITKKLEDEQFVQAFASSAQTSLIKYVVITRPDDQLRISKIFQLLSKIQLIPPDVMTALFFQAYVGKIPIADIIKNMYVKGKVKLETSL
ncbi:nuclear receptor subfamily 2 group E member 1 [Dendroctonus ponderosae]|uniref:nuclear receptor subfamily 2 group E member 1 n=1 Tax=Dendroctonus ponderosae TaxID=77166 RepID=UPI00203501C2|nr:nuclear receptor subfamily 2 group E member 1 [Dendroctonus ponderosae]